jgi:hypothetical protein
MSNKKKRIRSVSDMQLAELSALWLLSDSQAARRSANFAGTLFSANFAKRAAFLPEEPLVSEVQTLLNSAAGAIECATCGHGRRAKQSVSMPMSQVHGNIANRSCRVLRREGVNAVSGTARPPVHRHRRYAAQGKIARHRFGTQTALGAFLPSRVRLRGIGPQHAAKLAGKLLAMGCDAIVTRKSICLPP